MAEKIKLGSNGNFGVKEGGTLAYNDENGVFKAIELASSRASGATYVAESGLIADAESGVPRIDWTNGVGELLLEPQSTNLITYSEDFSNGWVNLSSNTTVETNTLDTTSPDGTNNATKLTKVAGNPTLRFTGLTIGQPYVFTLYAKSGTSTLLTLDIGDTDQLDIVLTNDWVRYEVSTSSAANNWVDIEMDALSGVGETIYIFGAQVENLTYSTSYIRTSGSSVTRIADAVSGNSSLGQVINSSEGVLYFEGRSLYDTPSSDGIIRIESSSSPTNEYVDFRYDTVQNRVQMVVRTGGVNQTTSGVVISDTTDNNKFAVKWKVNDIALWINGVEQISVSSASVPTGLDSLKYSNFYGRTKELKVYDTALTDAQLTTLTTL